MHAAYVRLTSNPFAKVGSEKITSSRFEVDLHSLIRRYDGVLDRA